MGKRTPLYDAHVKCGGKIVDFAGYELPVQYEAGVITEHMAVREQAGLFDVSHMGEVTCKGPDALANIQMMMTNDFNGMVDGQARYSPMCNENGGTVDDLIVYKKGDDDYLIVVNAANREKDYQWMLDHQFGDVEFKDVSDDWAQLALQGPKAIDILGKITDAADIPEKNYHAVMNGNVGGIDCIVSRTGYTGEDGVELYLPADKAEEMWFKLLEVGKDDGLIPAGLGARDTLRMEAAMPLYGHEMNDDITPLETGLSFAVKLAKDDFIGKAAMEAKGKEIKRVGLEVVGRGIIREEMPVFKGDEQIGTTTSGTKGPYIDKAVGMAIVKADSCAKGDKLQVEVRGRRVDVEVVGLPFYKRAK